MELLAHYLVSDLNRFFVVSRYFPNTNPMMDDDKMSKNMFISFSANG